MKKILSVLLVVTLILSCFMAVSASADVPELKGPGNVVLKRLGYSAAFDPNTDLCGTLIEEVTGYQAQYYMLPAENADEKLAMEVTGGADYDVVNLSYDQFQTLKSQGALMPLNDLLDAYGPAVKAALTEETWKSVSDDEGNIYAVAYKYPYEKEVNSYMQCRWDLMKAAGIEKLPETIDEFYNDLVTLKAFYGDEYIIFTGPNREIAEGKAQWVLPLAITSAFGIYDDWMVDEEGKVYYMTEAEGFQDMCDFMAKCYSEGLLDPEWAANTTSSVTEKFSSGRAIITMAGRNISQVVSPAMIENLGLDWSDFGYIGPLTGKDGLCKYQESNSCSEVSAILRSSKNAADVMNWWNMRVENQLYLNFGVEGVHFTYDEKGDIDPINPIFADERGNSYYYLDVTDEATFGHDWPSRVRKSQGQYEAFKSVAIYCAENRPEIYVKDVFAPMATGNAFGRYNVGLFNSVQDWLLQIMNGNKNFDSLKTFMSDWSVNGGEEVRTELQTWYDGYYTK